MKRVSLNNVLLESPVKESVIDVTNEKWGQSN